jgi:toxin ParE1/3/4
VIKARFLPEADLELIKEVIYYSTPSFSETRSMLVKGFPFSVVYRASKREVLVVAVAPHGRQPGYWASRVD